jgi:hypothetical protein
MWFSGDEIFWVKILLYIILCVFSEQLCGRARRKSDKQEGFVNGRHFIAFDTVLRDMLFEGKAVNTRETEQLKRLRSRKFLPKGQLGYSL